MFAEHVQVVRTAERFLHRAQVAQRGGGGHAAQPAAHLERVAQLLDGNPHGMEPLGRVEHAKPIEGAHDTPGALRDAPLHRRRDVRHADAVGVGGQGLEGQATLRALRGRQRVPHDADGRGPRAGQRAPDGGLRQRMSRRGACPFGVKRGGHVEFAHGAERPGDAAHGRAGTFGRGCVGFENRHHLAETPRRHTRLMYRGGLPAEGGRHGGVEGRDARSEQAVDW